MASKKSKNRPAVSVPEESVRPGKAPYDPARDILVRCLERVTADDAAGYVENPAVQFTRKAKDGEFDELNDTEYDAALAEVEALSGLWYGQPRRPAGDILVSMLERITIPLDRLESFVDPLMAWYDAEDGRLDGQGNPRRPSGNRPEAAAVGAAIGALFKPRRPAEIRDAIAARVIGQEAAVKAAAMIVYSQLAGRRTNAVFCGPTGSGKTEIWRCLEREFPKLIRIVDFSRFSADGWAGSNHVRNLFDGLNLDDVERQGLIIVLDEADKIVCEKAVGASGTDHNRITQNNLLRMMDGDRIEFGAEQGQPAFSISCGKVSIVMLGTFETLLAKKSSGKARRIGFGAAPEAEVPKREGITYDDLIGAGMRQEIAGRINRIVALDALGASGYKAILEGPALSDLEKSMGCRIAIDGAAADMLSKQAAMSGMGVRWAKSQMRNAVDDAMFGMADAEEYRIGADGGKLRCMALKRPVPEAAVQEDDEPLPF